MTLLVPTTPSKVLAVGLNYRSHLREGRRRRSRIYKAPSCLIPQGADIVLPRGRTTSITRGSWSSSSASGPSVAPGEAKAYVLGVTCGNDISAQVWQKGDLQWWRAKGSDTFGPCGPFLVSGLDYDDLGLELRINGDVKQRRAPRTSSTAWRRSSSWISQAVTLEPGDLIYTGTPGLTTALKPGDVVEVEIEGIGLLKNGVKAEP